MSKISDATETITKAIDEAGDPKRIVAVLQRVPERLTRAEWIDFLELLIADLKMRLDCVRDAAADQASDESNDD